MQVRVRSQWAQAKKVMELSTILTPQTSRDGSVEQAQADAARANEVIGALLERLVERGVMTLEDACDVAGVYDDIEIIE